MATPCSRALPSLMAPPLGCCGRGCLLAVIRVRLSSYVAMSMKPSWWLGINTDHCDRGSLRTRFLRAPVASRETSRRLLLGIGARIDRIGEHMIDGDVARVDPTDGTAVASLQIKHPVHTSPENAAMESI